MNMPRILDRTITFMKNILNRIFSRKSPIDIRLNNKNRGNQQFYY